ncbi:hypothetical protein WJX84_010421 [Apatococcus fuscideae]|uniref:Uncharacterized protein n=1 Tax=Apatococcus fuscideae TaxID=2026836 RepID=A0AAW1SSL3_9CHLO
MDLTTDFLPELNDLLEIQDQWELEPCTALISSEQQVASLLPSETTRRQEDFHTIGRRQDAGPRMTSNNYSASVSAWNPSTGFPAEASHCYSCPPVSNA